MRKLCILLLLLVVPAWAKGDGKLFAQANQAYQEHRYARAAELYRSLTEQGVDDPAVWYNLGTSYLQLEDLGHARAALERARKLTPWDADVAHNLGVLRGKLQDPEPEESWVVRLAELFPQPTLAALTTVCNFGAGCLALLWLRKGNEVHAWLATAFLVGLLFFGGLLAVRANQAPLAAVVPETVQVKNGPGREFTDSVTLHAGSTVSVLVQQGDWVEVLALGHVKGWLRAEDLAR